MLPRPQTPKIVSSNTVLMPFILASVYELDARKMANLSFGFLGFYTYLGLRFFFNPRLCLDKCTECCTCLLGLPGSMIGKASPE